MDKPSVSVPTESRPTAEQLAKTLFYKEDGDILRSDARVIAYGAKVAEAYAASSSRLPVGRQQILDLVERYESEIKRGIWDVSQDGMRHILRDLKLLASLPVGESTPKIK